MKRREFLLAGGSLALSGLPAVSLAQSIGQVAGVQRLKVGDYTLTALSDGYIDIITPENQILQGIDTETYDATLAASGRGAGARQTDVNAYLVDTGARKIMIDAGTNQAMGPTLGHTHAALIAAGYNPDEITDILLTHLHADHAAGLLAEDGSTLYPNARVLLHQNEYDFWIKGTAPVAEMQSQFDLAQAVVAATGDRLELFTAEDLPLPGISAVPLFGHTPGHVGCVIESTGARLFVVSDIIHQPVIQLAYPDVSILFDIDRDQARETRKIVLDQVVADQERILGMHLPFPGAGTVERSGEGYRWVAEEREFF